MATFLAITVSNDPCDTLRVKRNEANLGAVETGENLNFHENFWSFLDFLGSNAGNAENTKR